MKNTIFNLPDLGEGLADAEIVEWHVKVGDEVKVDQSLVSMETAKALVEVPSPVEGKILKLYGKPGDTINTHEPLVEFEEINPLEIVDDQTEIDEIKKQKREPSQTVAGRLEISDSIYKEPLISKTANFLQKSHDKQIIRATPMVRALAQRLKVDLHKVIPTGPHGTFTIQDVEKSLENLDQAEKFEPLKGVRRVMSEVMSQSHREVVPVTIMDDAILYKWSKDEDISVRLILAMIKACQLEPALNAWFDGKTLSYRTMQAVHLGVAMDTEEGLFVPVIQHAEEYNAKTLRERLETLKREVQSRSIALEHLRGATITLSNFGKFSGRYANPIIVPPMVAILGVGRLREEPVVIEGEIRISAVLPVALTFDHRAVTGGQASRFLGVVIQELETN